MPDAPDPTPDPHLAETKREAAQAQAAAASRSNRNIQILAGTVFVALVAVVLVIVISGGDSGAKPDRAPKTTAETAGVAATKQLLDGIPQDGFTLGDTKTAKLNIIEFLDVQCPFCKAHQLDQQPTVIDQLVRPGKATLTMQPVAALGEDSQKGRIVVAKIAGQNLAWDFLNLWYWNQPTENTGYVTPTYLASLAAATPGLTGADTSLTITPAVKTKLAEIDAAAKALKVSQVPTFAIGKPGQPYSSYTVIDQNATSKPAGEQIVADAEKAIAES
ncbi:MAG: thioredoxin domain-containing protein [Patulibacter sp.]|nr:thioredoxin domain-containing protein [Patulibacter sp.]